MNEDYSYDVQEIREQLRREKDPRERKRLIELLGTVMYEHGMLKYEERQTPSD